MLRKLLNMGCSERPRSFYRRLYSSDIPSICRCQEMLTTLKQFPKSYKWRKLGTMKFRLQQVQKYRKLASEMEEDEKLLHSNMHPDLQSVMRPKRILLFQKMMDDAGVVDAQLCEEMKSGFRLVGQLESSGQFRPRLRAG